MSEFVLNKSVDVKTVAIKVKKVGEMVDFYKQVVGFVLKSEENNLSIFGTQEAGSQILILEETRSAEEFHGETKQLALFSIKVPTEDEFLKITKRILEKQYPIDESLKQGTKQSIFVTDLEGNRFEIFYDSAETSSKPSGVVEKLDLESAIDESVGQHEGLAEGAYLAHVQLNVGNEEELLYFYHDILGIHQLAETDVFSMNEGRFVITFQKVAAELLTSLPDPHIGLDFFAFEVEDTEQIKQLEKHLLEKEMKFFSDKKKSILTIYDPSGIEWWFVVK